MDFKTTRTDPKGAIAALFRATFAASEGASEGALIGNLVARMIATVPATDLRMYVAGDAGRPIAAVLFSRMTYSQGPRTVFILSPMAVETAQQGKGVGQGLLTYALSDLRQSGVDVALTYGDVRFYAKVGFCQIPATTAHPPLPLSFPQGWLGQSLTDRPLDPLQGPAGCVAPLDDPAFW